MKFICIYGPPATGKLTVAQELAKFTDYHIFHNHHTVDLVTDFFPFGSKPFSDTVFKLRELIVGQAAKANLNGVIFTFAYAHGDNDAELRKIITTVKKYKGEVCLVHLYAPKKVLLKRVESSSRKKYGKIKDSKLLEQKLAKLDFFTPFPSKNTLRMDNSAMTARQTAVKIVAHFRLDEPNGSSVRS